MGENLNQKNNQEEKLDLKKGFFKKVKLSIFNVEKYPELAVEGVPRVIGYLAKIVAVLTIVICVCLIIKTNQIVKQAVDFVETSFPDFSYQDGILDVKADEALKYENDYIGKVIVDTKIDTEQEENISNYTQEIEQKGNGVIILKDRIIIKNEAIMGTAAYEYSNVLNQMGFTNFDKNGVVKYARGTQMASLYISVFITIFIYAFSMYFLNTLMYVLMCSIFGYFASLFAKVKIRYAAIFNMAVYAITLSTILNIIYIVCRLFMNFSIQYFEVMYISVATIYLFAAIFIIKDDLLKKQVELTKIIEVQKEVKKEMEEKDKEEKPEEPEDDEKKEEKEKKKKDEGEGGPTPESTNA